MEPESSLPYKKYPLFLLNINVTWIFWQIFRKILKILNFLKLCSVGVVLFHACGQTDRHDEAGSLSSQFRWRAKKRAVVTLNIEVVYMTNKMRQIHNIYC
jgi:hypothetical protein